MAGSAQHHVLPLPLKTYYTLQFGELQVMEFVFWSWPLPIIDCFVSLLVSPSTVACVSCNSQRSFAANICRQGLAFTSATRRSSTFRGSLTPNGVMDLDPANQVDRHLIKLFLIARMKKLSTGYGFLSSHDLLKKITRWTSGSFLEIPTRSATNRSQSGYNTIY